MTGNNTCKDLNAQAIVLFLTDGTRINACVNIDREPGYDRLSDLISSNREPFLVLMNANLHRPGFKSPELHQTLFINKDHILWATPEEPTGTEE